MKNLKWMFLIATLLLATKVYAQGVEGFVPVGSFGDVNTGNLQTPEDKRAGFEFKQPGVFKVKQEEININGIAATRNSCIPVNPGVVNPANPTQGPTELFFYSNPSFAWQVSSKLTTLGSGSVKFSWYGDPNGVMRVEKLTYLGFGNVIDDAGKNYGYKNGTKVAAWAYLSEDPNNPSNFRFFYLGVDPVPWTVGTGHLHFPVWYSYLPPTDPNVAPKRIITNGTHRR